ncbi:Murein DD-endopeptidase MepM [bacterium HR29]|jgi:murein DD-endopeptidase MepM/ murein hydrolase activator NlpD|nr:Murein DD-endopeptidase MepM [bacterium HR29]
MRRRTFLLGLAGLAAAACSGRASEPAVQLRVRTPDPSPAAAFYEPTPTPTPIPPPELVLSSTESSQAGAILVSVTGGVVRGTLRFLERQYALIQGARSLYTFVGIGILDPPGTHPLRVEVVLPNGSTGTLEAAIAVAPTEWEVDYVEFTPDQVATYLDPAVVRAEEARLAEVYAAETPRKLWDGPWLLPVDGPVTTHFGQQRSVNGGPPSGHHSGVDIGAPEGTPVVASNGGRVALAEPLAVRGNMVILDHGGGVLSGYGHLSGFAVSAGQAVSAGDLIGYVGNTGLSTGAHLHWEMSVHGILVDALRWVDGRNGF